MPTKGETALLSGGAAAAGFGLGLLIGGNPVQAAELPPGIQVLTLDDASKKVLNDLASALEQVYASNEDLIAKLGSLQISGSGPVPKAILAPLVVGSLALPQNQSVQVYNSTKGPQTSPGGAIMWLVVDVQDPNTAVGFTFDGVTWEFNIATLIAEGLELPAYPSVWITKADPSATPPRFVLVFSAGNTAGFQWKTSMVVYAKFQGTGSTTLNQATGLIYTKGY